MAEFEEEYEWQPPSEAEMKVLQAKRERSDRISKLMGDYMLKGYKMLGSSCNECMTILLRDKQGVDYCVACNELDSDVGKDDPATSREAALRQAAEQQQRVQAIPQRDRPSLDTEQDASGPNSLGDQSYIRAVPSTRQRTSNALASVDGCVEVPLMTSPTHTLISATSNVQATDGRTTLPLVSRTDANYSEILDVTDSLGVLAAKLKWATQELEKSTSVESSIQLCQLIKACAETIPTLHKLQGRTDS